MFKNTVFQNRRNTGRQAKPQSFWPGSRWLNLLGAVALSFFLAAPAAAQSLDEQIGSLLGFNCEGFSGVIDEGSPLAILCNSGEGAGTSAGGNAAGAAQMAPSIVQERLQEARGAGDADVAAGTVTEISPQLSLIFSLEGETLDRDVTHFEDGFDSEILRLTAGFDSQVTDKFLAGVAFTYNEQDGDLNSGGDFDNDSFGLLAYASFLPTERFFIQATGGYASKGYEHTRTASFETEGVEQTFTGPVKGSYDGNEISGGILLGYDQPAGAVTFGPRASLDLVYTDVDGYSEKGTTGLELSFADTSEFSLQSRLGMAASMAISTGFGVLVPQMSANWVHEFENDQRTENFSFVDDTESVQYQYEDESPDRNFFELALGVSAVLPHGWQTFAQYRTLLGHDYFDSHVGAIGMRFDF